MDENRKTEIAIKLAKYIAKRGSNVTLSDATELKNIAKNIGISVSELKRFVKPLFEKFINEHFSTKK